MKTTNKKPYNTILDIYLSLYLGNKIISRYISDHITYNIARKVKNYTNIGFIHFL